MFESEIDDFFILAFSLLYGEVVTIWECDMLKDEVRVITPFSLPFIGLLQGHNKTFKNHTTIIRYLHGGGCIYGGFIHGRFAAEKD